MLVTVAVFETPIEAHIVRGRLDTEGISAFVIHEYHIWVNWFYSNALGGVKVQVSNNQLSEAIEVLKKINDGEFENELEECEGPIESIKCPKCKSDHIIEYRLSVKIALIVIWVFAIPLPYFQGQFKCLKCSFKWVSQDRNSYSVINKGFAIFIISIFYMVLIKIFFHFCKMQGNIQCY